jgi:hypothetical protein
VCTAFQPLKQFASQPTAQRGSCLLETERRELLAHVVDTVWLDDQHVIAVQPTKTFAPSFSSRQAEKKGASAKSGSDGTRTRDLRRDRPAF